MSARMPTIYGDSYGNMAQNAIAAQSLDDALLANMMANRARTRDADFQERKFLSDDDYRKWVAAREQEYRDKSLAQSGDQFTQNLKFNQAAQANDLDYKNRALTQSGNQFAENLGFQREGRGQDNAYRLTALGQSGDQFNRNLGFQQDSRNLDAQFKNLDNAYRYAALNQSGNQFNASLNQNATQQEAANRLAMLGLVDSRASRAQRAGYDDRVLAQSGDLTRLQLKQADDVNQYNREKLTAQEAKSDQRVEDAKSAALYKELFTNISNGVIHTPEELDSWEGGNLSSEQYTNLNALLQEANRRQGTAYEGTERKAGALNTVMANKLAPLQASYDKTTADIDKAPVERPWYHFGVGATKEELGKSSAVKMYDQTRDQFTESVGKAKSYADVIYDPIGKGFIPLAPPPVGYKRPVAATPAGETEYDLPMKWPGTNLFIDPSIYDAARSEASKYTNDSDKAAVYKKYLSQAVSSGDAWEDKPAENPDGLDGYRRAWDNYYR